MLLLAAFVAFSVQQPLPPEPACALPRLASRPALAAPCGGVRGGMLFRTATSAVAYAPPRRPLASDPGAVDAAVVRPTRSETRGGALAQAAAAGPWVPKVGSGYHKLSVNSYRSRDVFGVRPGFEEFSDLSLTYYGEVGVLPRLALFGTVPLQRLRQRENARVTSSSSVGDVSVGIRHRWLTAPFVLSGSVLAKLPYLYDETAALPPGNGQEDFEGRLLVGKSLGGWGYFGLEAGYRVRLQEPSDEIRYLAEFGVPAGPHLYLRTKLDGTESVRNGDPIPGGIGNPTLNPEFDLGRLELTAGWNFGRPSPRGRVGAEFTWTRDLYGENTLRGNTFQLGVTLVN